MPKTKTKSPSSETFSSRECARIENLARLLDAYFTVPGTKIKIGLDGLIGLIPGVGDLLMTAVGSYIIYQAARIGVPYFVLIRMIFNLGLEALVGTIPILGDFFDIAWRANLRNANLARTYLDSGESRARTSEEARRKLAWAVGVTLLAFVVLMSILVVLILRGVFMLASSG